MFLYLKIIKDTEATWIRSIRHLAYNKTDSSVRVPFLAIAINK